MDLFDLSHEELHVEYQRVLQEVQQDGLALGRAAEEWQGDKTIVLAAMKQNRLAINFADYSVLGSDTEFVAAALRCAPYLWLKSEYEGRFSLAVAALFDSYYKSDDQQKLIVDVDRLLAKERADEIYAKLAADAKCTPRDPPDPAPPGGNGKVRL